MLRIITRTEGRIIYIIAFNYFYTDETSIFAITQHPHFERGL